MIRPRLAPKERRKRDFGLARGPACEQKVGEIRARDQQQHADRGQERVERLGEVGGASTTRHARPTEV